MRMPRTAAAAIAIPAIAPPDKPALGVCDPLGDSDDELLAMFPAVDNGDVAVADAAVEDIAVDVAWEEAPVVNRARSACWKATVIGCAHIVIGPETAVNIDVVPSRIELKPSFSANTVVIPALLA